MNIIKNTRQIMYLNNLVEDFLFEKINENNLISGIGSITDNLWLYIQNNKEIKFNINNKCPYRKLENNIIEIIKKYSIKGNEQILTFIYNSKIFKEFIEKYFNSMIKTAHFGDFENIYNNYANYFFYFCKKNNIKIEKYDIQYLKYLDKYDLLSDNELKKYFDALFKEKEIKKIEKIWVNFVDQLHTGFIYDYDFLYKYIKRIYDDKTYEKFINTIRLTEKYLYDRGLQNENLLKELSYLKKGNSHLKPLNKIKFNNKDLNIYIENKNNFYNMDYGSFISFISGKQLAKEFKDLIKIYHKDKQKDFLNEKEQKIVKKVIEKWNEDILKKEYISILDYYLKNSKDNNLYYSDNIHKKIVEIFNDMESLKSKDHYNNDINLFKNKMFIGSYDKSRYVQNKGISYIIKNENGKNKEILIKASKLKINEIISEYNKINRQPIYLKKNNILIIKYNINNYYCILKYIKNSKVQ